MKVKLARILETAASMDILWIALPIFMSFFLLCLTPLKEGDLWWHINFGKEILKTNHIPTYDMLTFTVRGLPYNFGHSWLSGVFFYIISELGGLSALVLLQALTSALVVWILIRFSLKRGGKPQSIGIITLIGWLSLYPFSSTRPQMFSFLIFAIFNITLLDFIDQRKARLWLLPALMIVWVNLHGAWTMGLILLAIYNFIFLIFTLGGKRPVYELKQIIGWSFVTLICTLIQPAGIKAYQVFVALNNIPELNLIIEWSPITITSIFARPFFVMLLIFVMALAYSKKRPELLDLLVFLVFAGLAMRYLRILPFFTVAAIPILIKLTSSGFNFDMHEYQNKFVRKSTPTVSNQPRLTNSIFFGILCLLTVLSIPQIRLKLTGQSETSLISSYFPIDAVQILEKGITTEKHVLIMPEWAGYILWRLYPTITVFRDSRGDLPQSLILDYEKINTADAQGFSILKEYQVDYLLLSKKAQGFFISQAEHYGWHCAYEDDTAVIFTTSAKDEIGNYPCSLSTSK